MKIIKNMVSMLLSLCLIMGLGTSVSANEILSENIMNNIEYLVNNDEVCIVKEYTTEGITIATNNKTTGILIIEKYDTFGKKLISKDIINLNEAVNSILSENNGIDLLNKDYERVYQNTFSNREYSILLYNNGKSNFWSLRSGDNEKSLFEDADNRSTLESFRTAVEDVNSAEFDIIFCAGITVGVTVIAGVVSGGVAGGVAAAGGLTSVAVAISDLNQAINDADYYYARV